MTLPFAAVVVIAIALFAGALGLAAFLWAIRTRQFSIQHLNQGATVIFDEDEPVGKPQDQIFVESDGKGKS
ncbi:MAG: cbb3-type cytochrome oxidase assembly protein CcoS [Bacteroidota bacterium]